MRETITTTELFEAGTTADEIEGERLLRIQAGAIRSAANGSEGEGWKLVSEWNLIGSG